MAGVWAVAWFADLSATQALAVGLAALPAGVVLASILARRVRGAPAVPAVTPALSAEGDFDPDEVIIQDANSGRKWRLGDVHFLSAAEKRRLETERPNVWRAYRARLLRDTTFPPGSPD